MNKKQMGYHSPEIEWWQVFAEAGFAASEEFSLEDVGEKEGEW